MTMQSTILLFMIFTKIRHPRPVCVGVTQRVREPGLALRKQMPFPGINSRGPAWSWTS